MRIFFTTIFLAIILNSCSAGYILKASYKELGILVNRKDIKEIIENSNTDEVTRNKLKLVLEVREFSKELGLIPKGSFSQYSKIDDEVLVWVLSGSLKNKLQGKTWWFPIVGNIPYKGFFDLEDAKTEKAELEVENYDTFLRSSDAFSTLGWFNDPLLSTVLRRDDLSIVNTVIHEIVHNTIWIKNNAAFNETMANVIGNIGTVEFYKSKNNDAMIQKSEEYLKRETQYAELLENTLARLDEIYKNEEEMTTSLETKRQEKFTDFRNSLLKINNSKNLQNLKVNNAYFLAQATYFNKFSRFFELYEKKGRSLKNMIIELKKLKSDENDPYSKL